MLKLSPTWQLPWITTAQSNLYFLQPKRIQATILEYTQFHFPFIQFLLLHNAYLRSFSAEISERKYFPFRFFFSHFLVNQIDPLDSSFREISHSVHFFLSSILELYQNPNIPIQIPQILILFGFSLHCKFNRNQHRVLGDNPNFRSDWDHCVSLHQNFLQQRLGSNNAAGREPHRSLTWPYTGCGH